MTLPSPSNPGLRNWLLIATLGIVWGGAFMSVRLSLDGYPPLTVAAGRVGMGAIAIVALGRLINQPLSSVSRVAGARGWIFAAIIGAAAVALPLTALAWGQQYVPSALAGVAMGAVPLLVLPLAYVFSPEEGIGPRRIAGMGLGFVGLMVLIGPGAFDGGGGWLVLLGRIACFGAALCYAVGSILTRRAPLMPPVALASATLVVAAVILVPIALIVDGWPDRFPLMPSLALIYAALLPTALAAILRVYVITSAGSVFMSLTSYMVPVWSVIFGITLMNEALPPQLFLALALILGGIALSQWRSLTAVFRR